MGRLATALWCAIAGCLLCVVAGCEKDSGLEAAAEPQPPGPTPNIVFVMIDTLRADSMGIYFNNEGHTPNQDALALEGVTFERAITQAPWTQPAIASLFCSRYPGVHKVLDYATAFRATHEGQPKVAVFDESFPTIAEALRERGYVTAGFVANPYIVEEFGFAQGFDHFDTSFANNLTPGNVVNDAAFAWLRQRDPNKPFFVYLHYMDCHGPYDAGPEFLDPLLARVEQMPRKRVLNDREFKELNYLKNQLPTVHDNPDLHRRLFRFQEYWAARYNAGVRQMDYYIGQLRAGLTEMGLWDDAYVMLTADHGEALCEHGLWEHGWSTHHTDLHVPLILRWPGVLPAGKRVLQTIRLIDVLPTLVEQLRLPTPPGMQGASLSPYIAGRPPSNPVIAFAEGVKLGGEQKAVYVGDWKLIKFVTSNTVQLYNIAQDPLEQNNLAGQQQIRVRNLLTILESQVSLNARLAAGFEAEQVPLSPERRRQLEILGYLQGSSP
ncbi:MAG TPA: sulfatase [Phycisphaerae bacterium]|nr:sulfatase [Phycisphaerae bacterium]